MKKIIKIIQEFFLVIFLLTQVITIALSAEETLIYSDPIDTSCTDTQIIRLWISGNKGIMGFRLCFDYDPESVEIISAGKGEVTKKGKFSHNIGNSKSSFNILWNNTDDVSTDGEIAVVQLRVLSEDVSPIEISYVQEDTFNENWEDVKLKCQGISDEKISKDPTETKVHTSSEVNIDLPVTEVLKNVENIHELSETRKKELVNKVNREISQAYGADNYFSDFDAMIKDYSHVLEEKLTEEVQLLETDLSGAEIIEQVLAETGSSEVTENNIEAVNSRFMEEGLNEIFFKVLEEKELTRIYNNIYLNNDKPAETAPSSETDEAAETKPLGAFSILLTAAAAIIIILILIIKKRKKTKESLT